MFKEETEDSVFIKQQLGKALNISPQFPVEDCVAICDVEVLPLLKTFIEECFGLFRYCVSLDIKSVDDVNIDS